jgi:hypothetical protein
MARKYEFLSDAQVEEFLNRGYIVLHDCFPCETAEAWTSLAFTRLGFDPNDSSTWERPQIHMPASLRVEWKEFMSKAWGAACELVGGEDRLKQPCLLGNSFIVNFYNGADRDWQPPSAQSPGWHKDGDFFLHFLDSPEQALLSLIIWSDIDHQGGGTFVAGDSVAPVARLLAAHPEGIRPGGFDFKAMIAECRDFTEFTGRAGDVVLLHPYILHASSQNASGKPRFLTNPAIQLTEPMKFHRANPDDYSVVELAVLRALGVDHLDFQPTSPREAIVPERVRIQQWMLEEEQARLAGTAPG